MESPIHFETSLNNGSLITDVSFERGSAESDDEAVIITLDGTDAAISPFRYPPIIEQTINGG